MQLNTMELVLTDLLDCGYADLDMLDILYSTLGDDIDYYLDRTELVKSGSLNDILYNFYSTCNEVIRDKAEDLLNEYLEYKEEGKDLTITELVQNLGDEVFSDEDGNFKPLTDEQIETIKDKLSEMQEQYPFANCLDSHFGTDLDQTLDEDTGIGDNASLLIEYWIK